MPDITVIGGAGHVGIPLVLAFAEAGMTVNVNDLNEATLATLRAGKLPFIEHGAAPLLVKALADNRLVFTSSPSQIRGSGPVIVTIGTPVDEFLNPVTAAVQRCIDDLLPHIVRRSVADPALDGFSGHHRLAAHLSGAARPQEQNRLLPGARRAGLRHQGTGRDAADRQRHDAGSGRRGRGAVQPHRAGSRRRCAARGRTRQAVQQRLSLHRIRRHQPVLHDREIGRRRLSGDHEGDEAQLSARPHIAGAGLRRRSLPVQGYDAARGFCPQPVQYRSCGDAGERRPGAATGRAISSAITTWRT